MRYSPIVCEHRGHLRDWSVCSDVNNTELKVQICVIRTGPDSQTFEAELVRASGTDSAVHEWLETDTTMLAIRLLLILSFCLGLRFDLRRNNLLDAGIGRL